MVSSTANPTLTAVIAAYAAGTTPDAIPADVRERAKLVIMDEMACAAFGGRSIAGGLAARYVRGLGGIGDARVLGIDLKVPAPHAALANGTAGHGEEMDGAHVVGGHPGATVVHAAVATAERRRATGADLLTAVVLGYDVGVRTLKGCGGLFSVTQRLQLHADFLYSVGAAAAAGRILGFNPLLQSHAMTLATFQANGLVALFREDRHISKSFSNGQYAYAGVAGALMAEVGLEGCPDVLGGVGGVLDAWGVDDGAAALVRDLGSDFAIMGANFKFLNAGYPIHAAVEGTMQLLDEHVIKAADIDGVQIGMPANAMRVVDNRTMHNICVQDMLTAAVVNQGLSLRESPFPAVLDDAEYVRLRPRVTLTVDPDLERRFPNGRGANVAVTLHDGRTVATRVDHPRGHSLRGGTDWPDLAEKWHEALPDHDVDHIISLVRELDSLDDVTALTAAFRPIQ